MAPVAVGAEPSRCADAARAGAELRYWTRRLRWRAPRSHGERLVLLLHALATPLLALRDAVRGVRVHGHTVATVGGPSRSRQFAQQLVLRARHGTKTGSYYRFQLYRPERRAYAPAFVQAHENLAIARAFRAAYAPAAGILRDKRAFAVWCRRCGIPAATTVASFTSGEAAPSNLVLPPQDLISKPVTAFGGRGVRLWRHVDGLYVGPDNIARSAGELVEELVTSSRWSGTVLQLRLRNHPDIADLGDTGLCTVRLMTLREAQHEPRVLLAVYRMTVDGAPADNFDRGGLAAPITLETGRLGTAIRKDPRLLESLHDSHPTTGAPIAGRILPLWEATVALGLRAHAALPPYPLVGWDIAITDRGPLLLEGNENPCHALAQMPSGVPLCATPYAEVVLSALRDVGRQH